LGFIIIYCVLCLLLGLDPYDIYKRHIARIPHVTGQITLSINDQITPIGSDCRFTYKNSHLEQPKEIKLKDGCFSESFGEYGTHKMLLELSTDFCIKNIDKNMRNGLKIQFGYFTTNNWHKENTDLFIFVEDITDESCSVRLKQVVNGDDSGEIEKSFSIKFDSQTNDDVLVIEQRFLVGAVFRALHVT
jgi:hypothetical protein